MLTFASYHSSQSVSSSPAFGVVQVVAVPQRIRRGFSRKQICGSHEADLREQERQCRVDQSVTYYCHQPQADPVFGGYFDGDGRDCQVEDTPERRSPGVSLRPGHRTNFVIRSLSSPSTTLSTAARHLPFQFPIFSP